MSIRFRCPGCEHKLRAADEVAGKQRRCKCGASVTVPFPAVSLKTDKRKSFRNAWRIEPRVKSGDLCEVITAYAPICAPGLARISEENGRSSYWQGMLAGSAGVLVINLFLAICFFALRQGPTGQQTALIPNNPPSAKNVADSPEPDGNTLKPSDADVAAHKPAPESAKDKASPGNVPVPPKKIVVDDPPRKAGLKSVPFDPDKIEVLEWYTTAKLAIIGDSGKEEPLELGEAGVKGGIVFVAVKVRLAGRMLEGKMFDVEKSDTALYTPGSVDPYWAIGCTFDNRLWFAPEKGQHAYAVAGKDGYITQGWLFYAPLKELQTGRTTFQLKDQRAVTLTLATRRP